jgi:hypothetical protein
LSSEQENGGVSSDFEKQLRKLSLFAGFAAAATAWRLVYAAQL